MFFPGFFDGAGFFQEMLKHIFEKNVHHCGPAAGYVKAAGSPLVLLLDEVQFLLQILLVDGERFGFLTCVRFDFSKADACAFDSFLVGHREGQGCVTGGDRENGLRCFPFIGSSRI